ncbi:ATP-binding cassette domain-containing protein [Aeromicrobium sp. UC242_57]|uniref:ATP-binding cassette domain-containing protein n=1 Tax=Aeromicrobium sp. UC242_57 TaxID=3374624 RepID=UPI0037BBB372
MTDIAPAPTLSVQGLRKSFGRTEVLRGVDLDVQAGEFVGLMGPNGAGKSTLIKILDGLYFTELGPNLGGWSSGGQPANQPRRRLRPSGPGSDRCALSR